MAILLQQLRKRYIGPDGSVVPFVDIVRVELNDEDHVALLGSGGSGKTTLLHLSAEILTPDSRRIFFDFHDDRSAGPGGHVLDYQPTERPAAAKPGTNVDLADQNEAN